MMITETGLVILRESSIHNKGLYAKIDIPKGTQIIQYIGRRLTQRQADKVAEVHGESLIYLFELNERHVIDGNTDDNLAKYINHACEPNCYTENDGKEIWIHALKDIKAGEELTYDYGFQRAEWHERPCLCEKDSCFGFVVARKYWSGIRQTKRYQSMMTA